MKKVERQKWGAGIFNQHGHGDFRQGRGETGVRSSVVQQRSSMKMSDEGEVCGRFQQIKRSKTLRPGKKIPTTDRLSTYPTRIWNSQIDI